MPVLDHLEELRWRIIYALAAVAVCVAVSLWATLRFDVVGLLARPVLPLVPDHKLFFTHPSDKLAITLNVAVWMGVILASPVIVLQAWTFLAPALHANERKVGLGVLAGGVLLFACGTSLAYFVVLPLSLPWLIGFGSDSMVPLLTASDYFGFVIAMALTFGLSFELPIVILALSSLGIVSVRFLTAYRRHAIVLILVVGAFLTPGDFVWTTAALAVPLYGLYELSVLGAYLIERGRRRREPALGV